MRILVHQVRGRLLCSSLHFSTLSFTASEEHLALITQKCFSYNAALEDSKRQVHRAFTFPDSTFSPPSLNCNIPAATKEITVHYSFDFAQKVSVFALSLIHAHVPQLNKSFPQVHYPRNSLQPSPIYLLTPRTAALFGICCEAIPRQVKYIIDEVSDTGKGANTVVSMLDYYFDHHGLGERTATLHADNCCGQNKNNTMMQYLVESEDRAA